MSDQIHYIKPTFAGGEYAPSMYSRVDVSRYQSGAKKMYNFIVHPHGGASNRPGWHYAATAKYASRQCRMHDFQFSSTQTYALEIGHQYVRFYTNNAQIAVSSPSAWLTSTSYVVGNFVTNGGTTYYCIVAHTSGTFATDLAAAKWVAQTIYEVPMPYAESELPALNFTQSADVLFMFHPLYQPRQLNRLGATNWTVTLYDFQFGPFQVPNSTTTFTLTPSATTGAGTLTASTALFAAGHVGGLFQVNHNVPEASVSSSLASVAAGSSITCGGTWRIITHGTWAGTIAVQKSTDGGSTWGNIRSFSSASDFNANTFGTEDMSNNAPNFLVRLNMSAYTSGTCSYTLTADAFRNVGVVKITSYSSATSVGYTVTKTLGGTTATADWAEGSWSDYAGWPAVGEFNQDRLVTGNTANEPQTVWQTKASNYYDYSRSSPLVDSDGITTNLPSRQLNGINGFVPLTQLIALTSASEWGIATTNGVMSPLTITEKVYGYNGSYGIKPVIIKNRAVYVQFMGATILDLGYELLSDTFTGSDLSILANHLFEGYGIIDMCYQQYPDSLVWAVRDDGHLLSLTYLREQEVIAWAHHQTNGLVESCCSIPASGYNQVWLSVRRGDYRFIEYMDHRMASTLPEDQFFVDSGLSYDGSVPDSFVKLWLEFDGANNSQTFIDSNTSAKTVTTNGQAFISTTQSKFGGSSGWFIGDGGIDSYVKLMLHCDGTNASTTFTDSESSPKTMTANGNAMISTSVSKFGGASGYFGGGGIDSNTGLMLHLENNATDSSTGAKTVTNHSATFSNSVFKIGSYSGLFNGSNAYLSTPDHADFRLSNSDFTIDLWVRGTDWANAPNTPQIQVFCNTGDEGSGTASYIFRWNCDGGSGNSGHIQWYWATAASGGSGYPGNAPITWAWTPVNATWYHLALVRSGNTINLYVNGVALTGSTSVFNETIRNSSDQFNIGARQNGATQSFYGYIDEFRFSKGIARWTSTFTPPITPYSAGDYLTTPDSSDFTLAGSDFTFDFWIYGLNWFSGVNQTIFNQGDNGAGTLASFLRYDGVSALKYIYTTDGSTLKTATFSWTPTNNTWYHMAVVRSTTSVYLFVNGTQVGSTYSISTDVITNSTGTFDIGSRIASTARLEYFNGYIDEFRYSQIARWTTTFTPAVAAYSNPGYLSLVDSADWNFGTGEFTIDGWVYLSSTLANQTIWSQGTDSTHYAALQFDGTHFKFSSPNGAAVTLTSTSAVSLSTWYHIALVRYGNIWTLYVNGTPEASTNLSATYSDYTGVFVFGCLYNGSPSNYLIGYLDEWKIAKGVARYTAAFTPPTVPGFQLSSNVITGLDHLNGYLVSILADGAVQAQQTVASGQITITSPATKVHVGLPYTSDLETLNIEAPLPDGTMQGRKLRVSKVTIRVLNSKGGYIGPDENHLKLIKSVFADYATTTALYTGDLKHSLGGGYQDGGRMFIRQTDPLPITVLALMPLVSVAGMSMESA